MVVGKWEWIINIPSLDYGTDSSVFLINFNMDADLIQCNDITLCQLPSLLADHGHPSKRLKRNTKYSLHNLGCECQPTGSPLCGRNYFRLNCEFEVTVKYEVGINAKRC
jgi:hypothetical protein